MKLILLVSIAALVYTYLGYPVLLLILRGRRRREEATEGELPSLSVLVAAYNEEKWIGKKIANTLALDYPAERLELWIGSDGSSDRTDEIVRACPDPRVHLLRRERGGKAAMLGELAREARGDILVFSDANTELEPGALRALAARFSDPEVGLVCGELTYYDPKRGIGSEDEEGLYWRYERWLKRREGELGALIGANGGIYAVRRELFRPLPPDTIVDDFVVTARVLEAGRRAEYEERARGHEETAGSTAREFGRRTRIGAGNFQALFRHPGLLSPRRPTVLLAYLSHKVLRWAAPFLMIATLLASLALAFEGPLYMVLLLGQIAFYGLALYGKGKLGRVANYFVAMNAALAVGFVRFLRGSQNAAWQRTPRASEG